MAAQRLHEAIEAASAEALLWAAAPEPAVARTLGTTFGEIRHLAVGRPHLGDLLDTLSRWFTDVGARLDPVEADLGHLTDALLASIDLGAGSLPFDPGSDSAAAITRLLKEAGLTPPAALALIIDLADESRATVIAMDRASTDGETVIGTDAHADEARPAGPRATVEWAPSGPTVDTRRFEIDTPTLEAAATDREVDGPIWIAPDERDLLVDAIHRELMPQLFELAGHPGVATEDTGAGFLLESTANALAVIGLAACARVLAQAARKVLADGDDISLADTASWLVDLAELLASDDPTQTTDALAESTARLAVSESDALLHEVGRLRIGIDPASRDRPRREVAADDLDLTPAADVIPAVLVDMLRELPGHADALIAAIAAIGAGDHAEAVDRAKRIAHTLKGDANTVGIRGLANLTHAMEDIFVEIGRHGADWPEGVLSLLAEAADATASMADHLLGRGAPPENAVDILARVYAMADALERDEPLPDFASPMPEPAASDPAQPAQADAKAATTEESVTLPRSVVDRLLQLAAESIALGVQLRSALESTAESRAAVADELTRAAGAANQLDEQVGYRELALAEKRRNQLAVDPMELDEYNELYVVSRRVQETAADARERLRLLDEASSRAETLLTRKLRVDDDLQSLVRRSRLVDVATHRARFERAVRQAARMVDKRVELQLVGAEARVDKLLLDALVEPLMHLLRNAVDHGIEPPDRRESVGKPAQGRIMLAFRERSQMLEVTVEDDGTGLDIERIRERGLRLGMIDTATTDPTLLKDLLFRPGFSTRDVVTQVSGRGVGLDVVARRLQQLGGRVNVDHEPGAGTRFELRIPLSIGALHVAVVPVRGHDYALATDGIARFEPLGAEDVRDTPSGKLARIGDAWAPAMDIGSLFGFGPIVQPDRDCVGAIVGEGEAIGVVLCERIETLSLVVLESLGERLPPQPGLRGATVLGDGRAVPVLDLGEHWRLRDRRTQLTAMPQTTIERPTRVVVADDSLTIRRALGDLLRDAGYEVELARDGLEALMACERNAPAVLLVDLEMPRMNGLELAAHLRKDTRFAAMPIVMITSRTAERHRAMAEAAGVDAVLGKPYSDDDVLEMLGTHLH
jgi:chemosensory pili system protein ChpA (sensor histidine kinase/response regulator)